MLAEQHKTEVTASSAICMIGRENIIGDETASTNSLRYTNISRAIHLEIRRNNTKSFEIESKVADEEERLCS